TLATPDLTRCPSPGRRTPRPAAPWGSPASTEPGEANTRGRNLTVVAGLGPANLIASGTLAGLKINVFLVPCLRRSTGLGLVGSPPNPRTEAPSMIAVSVSNGPSLRNIQNSWA